MRIIKDFLNRIYGDTDSVTSENLQHDETRTISEELKASDVDHRTIEQGILVTLAGTSDCNGLYVRAGILSGKPYYVFNNYRIIWSASNYRWELQQITPNAVMYYNDTSDNLTQPFYDLNWTASSGASPVPTLSTHSATTKVKNIDLIVGEDDTALDGGSRVADNEDAELATVAYIKKAAKVKHVFESFTISQRPINTGNLNDLWLKIMADRMTNNFESYSNFLFDVTDSGNSWTGLQFANATEFITWHNANTTNETVYNVYGLIDQKAISLHKVYGRNNALSIIKGSDSGRSNYHKGGSGANSNWEHIDAFSVDILERVTGVTPSVATDAKGAIHFTNSNKSKYVLYDTLDTQQSIHFDGGVGSSKTKFNPSTNSFSSITGGEVFTAITGANGFYSVTPSGVWAFRGVQQMTDNMYIQGNLSYVKVYAFSNAANEIIVIVKPVGQDLFMLNYFGNTASTDLFVGSYNADDKMIVHKLNSSHYQYGNQPGSNISYWVNKSGLLLGATSATQYNLSRHTLKNMVLFYCDTDGNMSPLTHEIEWKIKTPGAKAYMLLNNSGRY